MLQRFQVLDLERTRLSDPAAVMLNDMLIEVWVLDVLGNDFLLHENQNPESWKWNKMDGNGQLKSCKPCRMSKSATLRRAEAFPFLRCLSLRACRITDQGAVPLLRATCGRSFQRPWVATWVATCHKVQVHTAHADLSLRDGFEKKYLQINSGYSKLFLETNYFEVDSPFAVLCPPPVFLLNR